MSNQDRYSIFDRSIETNGTLKQTELLKRGLIAFSPLAQGLLSDKYLDGIPEDSRIRTDGRFLKESALTADKLRKIRDLNEIAKERGQTLAQMALAWDLRKDVLTSVIIGASRPSQIVDNVKAVSNITFSDAEANAINVLSREE